MIQLICRTWHRTPYDLTLLCRYWNSILCSLYVLENKKGSVFICITSALLQHPDCRSVWGDRSADGKESSGVCPSTPLLNYNTADMWHKPLFAKCISRSFWISIQIWEMNWPGLCHVISLLDALCICLFMLMCVYIELLDVVLYVKAFLTEQNWFTSNHFLLFVKQIVTIQQNVFKCLRCQSSYRF